MRIHALVLSLLFIAIGIFVGFCSGWVLFGDLEKKHEGRSQQRRKRETLPIVCLLRILSAQFEPLEGSLAIGAAG